MIITPLVLTVMLLVALIMGLLALSAVYDAASRTREIAIASVGDTNDSVYLKLRRRANAWLRGTKRGRKLSMRLAGAVVPLGPADFVGIVLGGGIVLGLIARPFLGYVAAAVVVFVVAFGADRWLDYRQKQRSDRFLAQLPELARVLGNAASAGLALRSGIDMVVNEMEDPAREEFAEVSRRLGLGTPLDDALRDLAQRLPSPELTVLVKTIVIQSRTGGALVTALNNIAETLEDRREVAREVKTSMAGAVFTGYLVVGIGVASVIFMNAISPGALDKMTQTLPGQIVLVVAFGLFALGQFMINRLTRIEV